MAHNPDLLFTDYEARLLGLALTTAGKISAGAHPSTEAMELLVLKRRLRLEPNDEAAIGAYDLLAELNGLAALCHDEGCPQHGTEHVCLNASGPILVGNGMPVERMRLDYACAYLSETSAYDGRELLLAWDALVAFYVAHRSESPVAGFAKWASSEGLDLTLAKKYVTQSGMGPATYLNDGTEFAWRAWANKPVTGKAPS